MKITEEEFNSLYSDTITKKEYDSIIDKIDSRFGEIMLFLVPDLARNSKSWFDYDNCSYESEVSGGFFDPEKYKEYIFIGGECKALSEPFVDHIPTKWLWEDFKDDYDKQVDDYHKTLKAEKEARKNKIQEGYLKKQVLQKSIREKLTEEELKVIKFK